MTNQNATINNLASMYHYFNLKILIFKTTYLIENRPCNTIMEELVEWDFGSHNLNGGDDLKEIIFPYSNISMPE